MNISDLSPIQFWPSGEETFNQQFVDGISRACFNLPFNCTDLITIPLTNPSGGETIKAFDSDGNELGTEKTFVAGVYTFRPSNDWPQLCGVQAQFKIYSSSDVLLYLSDAISFKTDHNNTTLITYSNSNYLLGINYTTSPPPEFIIRIPAIFFEERFPDESEQIDQSNSRIVRLVNQVKSQRMLDIGFMPFYMHKKLQLILTHDTVEIDGTEWVKNEAYELGDGNKRYPLKRAKVWLTDKNFIVRNVL